LEASQQVDLVEEGKEESATTLWIMHAEVEEDDRQYSDPMSNWYLLEEVEGVEVLLAAFKETMQEQEVVVSSV